jgi:hypothetical protein
VNTTLTKKERRGLEEVFLSIDTEKQQGVFTRLFLHRFHFSYPRLRRKNLSKSPKKGVKLMKFPKFSIKKRITKKNLSK